MSRHISLDETKERGYVMVAGLHPDSEVDATRKALCGLILRGQRRLHMAKET